MWSCATNLKKSETTNAENVRIQGEKYKIRQYKELDGAGTQSKTLSLEAKLTFLNTGHSLLPWHNTADRDAKQK